MTLLRILVSILAGVAVGGSGVGAAYCIASFTADHWHVSGHDDGGAGMAVGLLAFAVLSLLFGLGGFCFAFLRCWRACKPKGPEGRGPGLTP